MNKIAFPSSLIAAACMLACNTQSPQPANATPQAFTCTQLNGKQYMITISTGGKVDGTEIFSFHDKTAESNECLKYGFSASEYTCTPVSGGESVQFATTMTSPQEGRMDWKGTVTSERMSGTFVWSKPGQADIPYTFEGSVKQ